MAKPITSFAAFVFLLLAAGAGLQCGPSRGKGAGPGTDQTNTMPQQPIMEAGAQPQLVSSQFSFTEGPAADREGNVYFTDQPNDRIWKWSTDGQFTLFLEGTGRSNGMYFDKEGNLVTCADADNELWSISPDKRVQVLVSRVNGRRLNGPNDVWVHPSGNIYFTDPFYERPYWKHQEQEIPEQKVYFLKRGASEPSVAAEGLVKPNGIIGSPDGQWLFVADIGDNRTYRYRIGAEGQLIDRQLFVSQGSDGMTLDEQGNLYLTGKGVTVYNREGQKIAHIPIPANWTANVTFGGKDRNILFITASESIYILPMKVKGAQ